MQESNEVFNDGIFSIYQDTDKSYFAVLFGENFFTFTPMLIQDENYIVSIAVFYIKGEEFNLYSGVMAWEVKDTHPALCVKGKSFFTEKAGVFAATQESSGPIFENFKEVARLGRNISCDKSAWPVTIKNYWSAYSGNIEKTN